MLGRIVLLTAFDRGLWLAQNLAKQGLKCTILDVTAALEPTQEPFGIFKSKRLDPDLFHALEKTSIVESQPEGFCLWTEKGPLELRGWLGAYQVEKQILSDAVTEHLGFAETQSSPQNKNQIRYLKYEDAWLAHLSHQLASPWEREFPSSIQGDSLPLMSEYFIKTWTPTSLKKCQTLYSELGHEVFNATNLTDARITPQGLSSIYFHVGDKAEETPGAVFFCCLTRAELAFLSENISKALFKNELEESRWTWVQQHFECEPHRLLEQMPQTVLMIESLFDVLAFENLLMVQRTGNELRIWSRVASHRVKDKEHMEQHQAKIIRLFEERVPGVQMRVQPQEPGHSPSPWQVYGRLEGHLKLEVKNLWMVGPDAAETFDVLGQMEAQARAFQSFLKMSQEKKPAGVHA